jgi:hypothetical protein
MNQKVSKHQKAKRKIPQDNTSRLVKDIANLRRTYVIKFVDNMKVSSSGKILNVSKLQTNRIWE